MARGSLGMDEILESVGMVGRDHLDIRTVTLGIDLRGCRTPEDVIRRVTTTAGGLVEVTDAIAAETGVPIVNRRVSVTPIAWVAERPDPRAHPGPCAGHGRGRRGGRRRLHRRPLRPWLERASRIDEELVAQSHFPRLSPRRSGSVPR